MTAADVLLFRNSGLAILSSGKIYHGHKPNGRGNEINAIHWIQICFNLVTIITQAPTVVLTEQLATACIASSSAYTLLMHMCVHR